MFESVFNKGAFKHPLDCPHLISLTSVHKAKPEAIPKWQQMTLDPHFALVTPRKLVGDLMEIHLHHAQSLGELIVDGRHKPFRALACPLKPAVVRGGREAKRHQ